MIPRLQRFFGGDPAWWLYEAPGALVRAFMAMLPRLDAEEALGRASVQALGSGSMKKRDAMKLERQLRRAANGGASVRAARPSTAQLAMMGIGVRKAGEGDV